MANPRKFSEKIAIQKQKQAEEKAAFDQIMNDVLAATRRNNHTTINKNQHLHINPSVGNYRAESLPDVNRIGASPERNTIDLKGCLNDLGDMRNGRYPARRHPSPNASPRSPHHHHISGGHHRSSYNEQRRGGSSPYSPVYLSPPMDTNWRRTNSDSALHQTGLMAEQMGACSPLHQPGSPLSPTGPNSGASSPRRSTVHTVDTTTKTFTANSTLLPPNSTINNSANPNDILDPYPMVFASQNWDPGKTKMLPNQLNHDSLLSASLCNESRPKSCEVPGITIQPTPEDSSSSSSCSSNNNNIINENSVQHPSSSLSNTGSLPDLTTLHFPAPLPTPIDLDEQTLNPVTSLMRNTIITESVYPNNNNSIESNPSPGSPFTCITSNSFSTNTTNTNNSSKQNQSYSSSPSSPYGQQQNIFTQDTLSSHIIANNNSENSLVLNSNPNHTTNTTTIINNNNSKQNQSYSPAPSSPYGQQQNIFTQDTLSSSHIITNNNSENSIVLNSNPNQTNNNNSETANIINSPNPTFHHYSTNEVTVSHHNPFNTNLLPASLPNDSRPKSTGGVPGITIETLEDSSNNIHHHPSHLHNPHLNHSHQHHQHQHHNHSHSHSNHHQQHPSFANTGSLPDLTNLQYTTSLSPNTDLDQPSLSPVTNTMANTILTDAYPNASPSPGSPYNCVSSTSFVNQTSTNYSTLPASSASFVQQQSSIFTQNTFDDLIDQNDFDFINYFEN